MDEKKLQALATKLAKNLKTPEDLSQLSRFLKKMTVETALKAELAAHLGHEKHQPKSDSNTRNGYSPKTLLTEDGDLDLQIPRDRESKPCLRFCVIAIFILIKRDRSNGHRIQS
ncbi:mutator family transposase [Xenorhabdus cabanillasii]|uniref:Mutator family transposase n=1 Tax=Xenorhabdus cabanillasii TaxID=351673 RepID=A0A3D9UMZ8_9GAMM|nr:mutator family transposase [Xenorhabdus cabanillasii]